MMEQVNAQTIKKSTISAQVRVLDTAFYMPQLKRHRRIWIYLPKDYSATRKKYPVLYLQDGQNVFDAATSFSGEWGVDEAMDSLAPQFGGCIIVAIDNGADKRLSEYAPFDFSLNNGNNKTDVKSEGDAYVDFLIRTLRPYLQKNFRVKRTSNAHFIAGSSMGGLIAYYALLKAPKKWGGAGIFSPAFWIVRQPLLQATASKGGYIRSPLYFYAGQKEGAEMVPDMLAVMQELDKVSKAKQTSVIRAGGQHSEGTWRNEFPQFYEWMMSHVK
jgi:predicted alpha/beta superfamily hydrolase